MQTIKTGVVIALLIAVCYGAFVALNAPEADIPDSIQEWANSQDLETLDVDMGFDLGSAQSVSPDSLLGDFALPNNPTPNTPTAEGMPDSTASLPAVNFPDPNSTGGFLGGFEPSLPEFPSTPDLPQGLAGTAPAGNDLSFGAGLPPFAADGPSVPFHANGPTTPPLGDLVSAPLSSASSGASGSSFDLPPAEFEAIGAAGSASARLATDGLPVFGAEAGKSSSEASSTKQPALPELPFAIAREQALMKANSGQLKEALTLLTPFYNSPEIGFEEHKDLLEILDALSREVIYSPRHLLEASYTTGPNETVASVAEKHRITPELLTAINGLGSTNALAPGTPLKMITGPFRAQVHLGRGELTLFVGELYAGRFPIEINNDPIPQPGVYEVNDRRRDRTYIAAGGAVIQANEARNPFGGYWLSLGGNLSIHGSPKVDSPELQKAGCISLAPLDAANVYDILVKQSQVEIVR